MLRPILLVAGLALATVPVAHADDLSVAGELHAAITRRASIGPTTRAVQVDLGIETTTGVHLTVQTPVLLTSIIVRGPGFDVAVGAGSLARTPRDPSTGTYDYVFPLPGGPAHAWRVELQVAEPSCAGEITLVAEPASEVTVGVLAGGVAVRSDRPVPVAVLAADGTAALTSPLVTAWLRRIDAPGAPRQPILVQDDGGGEDATAGDGVHSGTVAPTAPGAYVIEALVLGTARDGSLVERRTLQPLTVAAPEADLVRTGVTLTPRDPDGDGDVDQVEVVARVTAQVAGTYRLALTARGLDDAEVTEVASATLAAGPDQALPAVVLAGPDLDRLGPGPFELDATLTRDGAVGLADLQPGLATVARPPGGFDRPAVRLGEPTLTAGPAPVAALELALPVDVRAGAAGAYTLVGRVVGAGRVATELAVPVTLTAGAQVVRTTIPARTLLVSGAGGGYRTSGLALRRADGTTIEATDALGPELARSALAGHVACGDQASLSAAAGARAELTRDDGPARFSIPATLPLASGAQAGPSATLTFAGGDAALRCAYVGEGASYLWAGCDEVVGPGDVVLARTVTLEVAAAPAPVTVAVRLAPECDDCATCGTGASCGGPADAPRVCACGPGLTGDGRTCTPASPCDQLACGEAFCVEDAGVARCECPDGQAAQDGRCQAPSCGPGQVSDGVGCVADPCATGNGGCDPSATCDSTSGVARCACPDGTLGDGVSCPAPTCASADCPDGCRPTEAGPVCIIDECAAGTATCPAGQACVDLVEGYDCVEVAATCPAPTCPDTCQLAADQRVMVALQARATAAAAWVYLALQEARSPWRTIGLGTVPVHTTWTPLAIPVTVPADFATGPLQVTLGAPARSDIVVTDARVTLAEVTDNDALINPGLADGLVGWSAWVPDDVATRVRWDRASTSVVLTGQAAINQPLARPLRAGDRYTVRARVRGASEARLNLALQGIGGSWPYLGFAACRPTASATTCEARLTVTAALAGQRVQVHLFGTQGVTTVEEVTLIREGTAEPTAPIACGLASLTEPTFASLAPWYPWNPGGDGGATPAAGPGSPATALRLRAASSPYYLAQPLTTAPVCP